MGGYMALTFLLSESSTEHPFYLQSSVFGQTCCSPFPLRKYFYVSTKKNWTDAQLYCRTHYHDLATFESMEEVSQLTRPGDVSTWAWIGLWDDPGSWKGPLGSDPNSWRWATTGQTVSSQYHNWSPGEPNYANRYELCALMLADGTWADAHCRSLRAFVCFTDVGPNQRTYHFISTGMTWTDAQAYCRQHHTDLPVLLSSEENTALHAAKPASSSIWLALSRVPWTWSDGTSSTFRNWRSISPNGPSFQHCGSENSAHEWDDEQCHILWSFICHEVRKVKTTIKVKTAADLTDTDVDQVLQKLSAAFHHEGWKDAKLKWSVRPNQTQETPP